MSENTKVIDNSSVEEQLDENKDVELDSLLNDALNDFGKTMLNPDKHNVKLEMANDDGLDGFKLETMTFESSMLNNLWNEPTMKEAMSHFESSIRSVFNSSQASKETDMSNMTQGISENINETSVEMKKSENEIVDIDSLIDDFRKMAKMTVETFSKDDSDSNLDRKEENHMLSEEFSKNFLQVAQKLSTSVVKTETLTNEDEDDNGFHNMVTQTIKSLSDNNRNLSSNFNLSDCSEQLSKLLKGIENEENVNKNFFQFMKVCMKTIKVVVYPSLKDLCEKYPTYIEDNKSTMTESDMVNCKKQFDVMDKICKLFESDEIDDSEKVDDNDVDNDKTDRLYKRFLNILNIMKEVQACGRLPEELDLKRSKFFEEVLTNLSDNQNNYTNCSIS